MKLASFSTAAGAAYGAVVGDGVVSLSAKFGEKAPTLRDLIAKDLIGEAAKFAQSAKPDLALSAVKFEPVIPNPDKIICVGLNYRDHVEETGRTVTEKPTLFARFAGCQVGHLQPMIKPKVSDQFDYEGEMAVIIGKPGRRISRDAALSHVAGYACYNDGSIRDWQRHTSQFAPGKNFAGTGAFGPWMVTTDEIPDISKQTIATRLNGMEVQAAPISDLVFDVPALIAYCSTFTELVAGDVIVTGTTGGVGAYRTPPLWMKEGDVVEVEISGIGVLRNPVKDEVASTATRAA
jgi:2-keto-4-pentenoate hydratase/2-oxohepta-3-ene-1,7-dioic acid hydratase in catechol pathway